MAISSSAKPDASRAAHRVHAPSATAAQTTSSVSRAEVTCGDVTVRAGLRTTTTTREKALQPRLSSEEKESGRADQERAGAADERDRDARRRRQTDERQQHGVD